MSIKNYISENKLLFVVLIVASILRFWNFFEIPLTHDEVSALNRTHFDNFSDLIEYGVKADTHPPGVQVFTYLWVKTFGYEQWIVKLPFILMGLGSLLISYSIFKRWSNETVALLIISFMATLQFTVMHGQIARPYVSGMFLILCMVYFWNMLVNEPEKYLWKNHILTAVFGAACGYNHHFTLLAAFLIGVTGIFVIDKKHILKYLLVGVLIFLLYLPNLSIFLHQLERGGVGEWLGAPKPKFIIDFFSYVSNHSLAVFFSFVLVLGIGIYNFKREHSTKWIWISGGWFFIVWIIGYYYSIHINPVLQKSMLLFLFPFMLYSFLGWIPKLSKKTQGILVLLVLFVGTSSLVFHRKHFEIFYANRYFQMKEDAAKWDQDKTCYVFATFPHFLEIDFPRNIDVPSEYLAWEENVNSIKEFESYIINCGKEQLFLGHVEQFPKELIAIAHTHYPNLIEVNYTHGAASYLFSKEKFISSLSYSVIHDVLSYPSLNYQEDLKNESGEYFDIAEWSIGTQINIQDALEHPYDLLVVKAVLRLNHSDQDVKVVTEFPNEERAEPYFYAARSAAECYYNKSDHTVNVITAFSMDNVLSMTEELPDLKTYIWNLSGESFYVLDYKIELWEGNRIKYSLEENF